MRNHTHDGIELIDRSPTADRSISSSEESQNAEISYRLPLRKQLWMKSDESRAYMFKLFTCFYALFIVITGVVIELSNIISNEGMSTKSGIKSMILEGWLFGCSIIFIFYCAYLVGRHHLEVLSKRKSARMSSGFSAEVEVLANSFTGSLYLRLGCVLFGMIGVVYYSLIVLICLLGWSSAEGECSSIANILNSMAGVFIFVQMWFVYCNGKIIFEGQGSLARMVLMVGNNSESSCTGVLCLFSGFNEFMYTCVVEYSLICAGVAFVFWTNIERCRREQVEKRMRKRSILKIDCSRTAEGLFVGFGFVILTIVSIALFNAYSGENDTAIWIFSCTNLVFFIISTFICGFGIWRTRWLKFSLEDDDEEDDSAELLDAILLVVGLIGELIFGTGGILSFVNHPSKGLPLVVFLTNIFRLVQVTIQSGFIIVCGKLRIDDNDVQMMRYKPGKQVITTLLLINCCQFLMNVFEAQKVGINDEMIALYGSHYWAIVVRGCSPLIIFYRFHSSACFAEIWKKTFRPPKSEHRSLHI
ncbi:unnamed protein product [Caenorhabditis auriculariae]|uniref:Uncharacterized protein n=1 Tax=Caenorhabditis auriculariae TaxID=2777116 RepID=A0A8S1H2I7_9PELO|nr:unnamed protein product [Caenorhabditis auriculariae]